MSIQNPAYDEQATDDATANQVKIDVDSNTSEKITYTKNPTNNVVNNANNMNLKPWKPYEDTKYDSPILNRYILPWPIYYKIRWFLISVFHTRLFFGVVLGEVVFFLLALGGLAGVLAALGHNLAKPDNNNNGGEEDDDGATESTGSIAIIPPALSFVFACRNSIWIVLTGLPFERALLWHKFFAYVTVIVAAWHGYISQEWDFSGTALTAFFVALPLFAFWPIRRHFFEAFYRFHWLLVIGVVVLSLAHGAGGILFGIAFWLVDLLLRCLVIFLNKKRETSVLGIRLPANVIRLTFLKKTFKYKAGQYCFLCIPGVSYFEWHPFSISSSPHENVVSIHIRVLGDWTKQLYDYIEETRNITVYIDGPYGAPGVDIDGDRYKSFMFISGGIGITPMQSICNDVLYQHRRGRPIQKVMFIWSVRDLHMVNSVLEYDRKYSEENVPKNLPSSFSPDLLNRSFGDILETNFHLTKERDESRFAEANIDPSKQDLKFGRPNLSELFQKMKASYVGGGRVAVLACGPTPLVKDAEKLCAQFSDWSCGGVSFDFHKEVFEF